MDLTKGELKGDGLVSNFSVNHSGFKEGPKEQKFLNFVRIHLDTFKVDLSNTHISNQASQSLCLSVRVQFSITRTPFKKKPVPTAGGASTGMTSAAWPLSASAAPPPAAGPCAPPPAAVLPSFPPVFACLGSFVGLTVFASLDSEPIPPERISTASSR